MLASPTWPIRSAIPRFSPSNLMRRTGLRAKASIWLSWVGSNTGSAAGYGMTRKLPPEHARWHTSKPVETLAERGITKQQSSRWQQTRDAAASSQTTQNFLRARGRKRRQKFARASSESTQILRRGGGETKTPIEAGTGTCGSCRGLSVLGMRVPVERDHGFRWKMITQSGGT